MKAIRIFTAMVLAVLLTVSAVGCTPAASAPAATDAPTGYRVLSETLAAEQYGIGFRNGDVALGLAVQEALDAMIADGKAAEISQKWFGEDVLLKDRPLLKKAKPARTTRLCRRFWTRAR
jgi:ABC-type amino acid transport substrate-binding protein